MAGLDVVGSWDWQREMENFATRMARSRDEEVNVVRRSTEEAERATLRRMDEIERRMQRCQAEEANAMQSFLTAWNGAMEAKFEKQRAQQANRGDISALSETIEQMRLEVSRQNEQAREQVKAAADAAAAATESAAACSRSSDALSETLQSQFASVSSVSAEAARKSEVAWDACESMRMQVEKVSESLRVQIEEVRRQVFDDIVAREQKTQAEIVAREQEMQADRERQTNHSFASLTARLETLVTARLEEFDASLAARLEPFNEVAKKTGAKMEKLECEFGSVHEEINVLAGKTRVTLEKHSCEFGDIRSLLESRETGVRSAMESLEKLADELRDLRGNCENRLEAQARMTADSCKRLAGEMRGMVDDATERAELAAANLDSKVAGALDAVMDARVARGTHECNEEVAAAKSALEKRLRGSEAATERLLHEESEKGKIHLYAEMSQFRDELRNHVKENFEELSKRGRLPSYTGSAMDVASGVNDLLTDGMAESMTVPQELRTALQRRSSNSDVASPETGHLKPSIHVATTAPDDVSSNVTVESDAQSSDSRQLSNWKANGATWRRSASPVMQKQSSEKLLGGSSRALGSSSPKMPAAPKAGNFATAPAPGNFNPAVAAKATWAPNPSLRSAENLSNRPSSFSSIGKGSPAKASAKANAGKNPFDLPTNVSTNPFSGTFKEDAALLGQPGSPTPSFASPADVGVPKASGIMRRPGEPVSSISPF